ncbi:MAG: 30S ribosomal protein S20 [Rickettsiales bacterium]|nr:30S ribosomal protein S20 [Rickettsiales bacterium]|tara:strand:+ start:1072 stop:1335 length:264 start_codon:yes stop_codon:yes gene_type:complete
MANIKSAKKRILQNLKRSEVNKIRKSRLRGMIKNIILMINRKDSKVAKKLFSELEPNLSKSVSIGLFKKNTVSRILSRISKKIKNIK